MTDRGRDRVVLGVCALVVVLLQWTRRDWFIDDAAICFAYARNLVDGWGFVAVPGGERIEGVSDPTWMALLVLFQALGLDGFRVAKPLALACSLGVLPLVLRLAREALPDPRSPAAWFAPFAAAVSAQLAIWSASGLENGLWCLLLAAALLVTPRSAREGRFLGAGALWLLLALTRPEGVVYGAIGGAWYLVGARRAGQRWIRNGAGLAATILVPFALVAAARLWYFAWPLPNTYYAKLETRALGGWAWNARGFDQIREWAGRLWTGWYFPVDLLGLVGTTGRSARIALVVLGVLALLLCWPGPDVVRALWLWPDLPEPPRLYVHVRTGLLVAAGVLMPLLARERRGFETLGLCWHCGVFSLLFSASSGGDWMGAYRWMSLLVPNLAVLLAVGIHEVAEVVSARLPDPEPRRAGWSGAGWLAAALLLLGLVPPNLSQLRDHALYNTNETPAMVRMRVIFTQSVARRTFYEGRVANLDMDMGAHLWWAPEYTELDMAGLVDVSMAHHWYDQRPFYEEYVFEEHPPTFAHVHGGWANETGFKTYDAWKEQMVELPPYEDLPGMPPHPGAWANRALFEAETWTGASGRRAGFTGGLVLEGLEVPVGAAAPGDELYVELGLRPLWRRDGDFTVVLFLADAAGVVKASAAVPRGMGLLPVRRWREGRITVERHAVPLPADLPEGTYDLGLLLLGPDGAPWRPGGPESGVGPGLVAGTEGDARLAVGEVRLPAAVRIEPRGSLDARAEATLAEAVALAGSGACEAAERAWILTKRHHPRSRSERWEAAEPTIRPALGACWARDAERRPEAAAASLARAHGWDPRGAELARIGAPVGERLWEAGTAARERRDWEAAYRAFSDLLTFQPWRSWARRYAEEARDHRLGL